MSVPGSREIIVKYYSERIKDADMRKLAFTLRFAKNIVLLSHCVEQHESDLSELVIDVRETEYSFYRRPKPAKTT